MVYCIEGDEMYTVRLRIERMQLLKILLIILFFYTIWFQYAVTVIPSFFTVLGLLLTMVVFTRITSELELKYLVGPFALIVIWTISSIVFSENYEVSFFELYSIIKYCLPMLAIYVFVGTSRSRFTKLCKIITFVVTLLALSLIIQGTPGSTGAIVLNDLNSNKFSCYINMGEMTALYLLCEKMLLRKKIVLFGAITVCGIAQFMAASRRGVVVYIFLLFVYFYSQVFIKNRKKSLKIIIGLIAGAVIVVAVASYLFLNADSILVVSRFMGNITLGDQARRLYQSTAMEIFCDNPLLGMGLGAVSTRIGMYSHSLYYEVLATSGLLGLCLLVLYFVWNTYRLCVFKKRVDDIVIKTQTYVIVGSMVSVLLAGIAVVYIYDIDFYILLGLFAAYRHIASEQMIESIEMC